MVPWGSGQCLRRNRLASCWAVGALISGVGRFGFRVPFKGLLRVTIRVQCGALIIRIGFCGSCIVYQ